MHFYFLKVSSPWSKKILNFDAIEWLRSCNTLSLRTSERITLRNVSAGIKRNLRQSSIFPVSPAYAGVVFSLTPRRYAEDDQLLTPEFPA